MHSSGDPKYDAYWKQRLLADLALMLGERRVDLMYVYGKSGAHDSVEAPDGVCLHVMPLCLNDGLLNNEVIPAIGRSLPNRVELLPSLEESSGELWKLLRRHLSCVYDQEDRRQATLLIVSHGRTHGAWTPWGSRDLKRHLPGFAAYGHTRLKDMEEWKGCSGRLVLVPWFMTRGKHVTRDIPVAFGLPQGGEAFGRHVVNGALIDYIEPLGTLPGMAALIAEAITSV